jgi:hypothetical protein
MSIGVSKLSAGTWPNELRKVAANEPLYTSWISGFGDDVSGNRSKAYNLHNNIYFSHANLPRRLLQQMFHVHFASTSQNASLTEQTFAVKEMVEYVQL